MTRKSCDSDLTDRQWEILSPLIPPAKFGGRPRTVNVREIVNGILYALRTGCQWRQLPHDLPPYSTVFKYHRRWTDDGTWQKIHDALVRMVRQQEGRDASPSAAIIDSQSVKSTEKRGSEDMTLERK